MKRISALSILLAVTSLFIAGQAASAADFDGSSVHVAAHRPLPSHECYIWGYYGWRQPYCGVMGGFYYQWGASYYLAPQHWGRNLFRYSYGYPYE